MSEYKKMSDWANEIGLVSGMKFENDSNIFYFTIISIVDNDYIIIKSNNCHCDYTANIDGFEYEYKLIYDPRSENKIEKEVEKTLLETLRENTRIKKAKFIDNSSIELIENWLTDELKKYSRTAIDSYCSCPMYLIPTDESQMIKRIIIKDFCDKNGLGCEYVNDRPNLLNSSFVRISW